MPSKSHFQVGNASQTEKFDYSTNRAAISADDLVAIGRRPNTLVLGLMAADEGASMGQCFYTMYYLLHGAVNMKTDVVALLKKQRVTFACVVSAEQLDQIEQIYKASSDGVIPARPKNFRQDSSCQDSLKGVNLKYNFMPDSSDNACRSDYRGPSANSEPESKALLAYIQEPASMVGCVVVLAK
jgi:hypothetical protein